MEWIESTGKDLDEAINKALDILGVKRKELEYEIIAEAKKGVFGLGGNDAHIRARVKPISREKPRDKKRREPRKPSGAKKRSENPTNSRTKKPSKKEEKMEQNESRESEEPKREYGEPLEKQAEYAQEFLKGLSQYFDDSCSISSQIEEDIITMSVDGKQVGLLIGSHGTTLFAIEELMRAVVQARVGGFTARMYLDVGGYRAKRKEALSEFATNLAAKVKESGRSQVLEPMVSADRKIVHDTIAEIDGVTTTSEGYDPKRRVVVLIDSGE